MSADLAQDPRSEKAPVSKARRIAARHGFRIEKSRQGLHLNNRGQYMLLDLYHNAVIAGRDYDMTAQEIIGYCEQHRKKD